MLLLLIACIFPINAYAENSDPDVSGGAISTEIVCVKVTYPAVEEPPIQQETPNPQIAVNEGNEGFVLIGESKIPFSAAITYPHWSLMNLFLIFANMIIWGGMLLIKRSPKNRIFDTERVAVQGIGLKGVFENRWRKRWTVIGTLLMFVGLALYILTQDFNGGMSYFDTWSVCYAFLTVGLIVTTSLLIRAVNRYSSENDME
jgi:hypothetical protein